MIPTFSQPTTMQQYHIKNTTTKTQEIMKIAEKRKTNKNVNNTLNNNPNRKNNYTQRENKKGKRVIFHISN